MSQNLRPEKAAEYLDTTVGTLGNWRMKGKGPAYVKSGRFVRYPKDELDKWLGRQLTKPRPSRSS